MRIVVIVIIVGLGIYGLSRISSINTGSYDNYSKPEITDPTDNEDRSVEAYLLIEELVKKQLVSPSSAKFPSWKISDHTTHLNDQRYKIDSYVDAQNSFGAMIRKHYTAEIEYRDGSWKFISFELED